MSPSLSSAIVSSAAAHDPQEQRRGLVRGEAIAILTLGTEDLEIAAERAEAPWLHHRADLLVAELPEAAVDLAPAVDVAAQRATLELSHSRRVREDVDEVCRRVVVRDDDHLLERAIDVAELVFVRRVDVGHEEQLDDRRGIERRVALMIRARHLVDVDHGDREILWLQIRILRERCGRSALELRAEIRVGRNRAELAEVCAQGRRGEEEKENQPRHARIFSATFSGVNP